MHISRLDHIQLAMPKGEEAKARAFYEGLLGIPEVPKPQNLAARGGCWFEVGLVKIHLGIDPEFVAARKAHPAFIVDNITELTKLLAKAGVTIFEDDPLAGYMRCYVSDPFGNRIELMEQITS